MMAPADDAFDPTTSGPPVLSLAGPDTVRDATSPPVMAPAEDALGRQQPSATSFSGESNDLPGMTARTMATTDNNKKSNVTPATPSLADPTLGDDRGIETYISCIVPLSTYSETLCALQKVSKGKDKRTSYYRDRDDSDDSQARARYQERFCRDRGGAGRNQTDKQYAVKAERRKTHNVKSVKPCHPPDTWMSGLDDDCEQQYAELARVQNGQAPLSLTCDTTVYDTPVFSLCGKVPDDLDPDPDDGSVLQDADIVTLSVSQLEEKIRDLHEPTSSRTLVPDLAGTQQGYYYIPAHLRLGREMYEQAILRAEETRRKELLDARKVESDASSIADCTLSNCGGPRTSINVTHVPFGSSVSPNVALNRTTQLSPTADTVCDKTIDATRATSVGKSNDLSGKKSIADPTSSDERNVELYISDTVPASLCSWARLMRLYIVSSLI
ncbi:MAG: hypothetical protein EBZ67_15700 [Chitinophagia bacterium]|nr:hypothetical protein [Chitinophagia bacterium]